LYSYTRGNARARAAVVVIVTRTLSTWLVSVRHQRCVDAVISRLHSTRRTTANLL